MLSDIIGWAILFLWFGAIAFCLWGWNKIVLPVMSKVQALAVKVNLEVEQSKADKDG